MAADKPHARHAAARRRRASERRRRLRLVALPAGILVVVVIAVLVVTRGDTSDRPEPGSAGQLALGEEVFAENCATCHGQGLRGGLAGPPLVSEIYRPSHHPDSAIRAAIAQGVQPHHWDFAAMPPIPGLSDDEIDAVIAYIRDVQRDAWDDERP